MKPLCMCKLEATFGDFRNKICKKRRQNTRGMLSGLVA